MNKKKAKGLLDQLKVKQEKLELEDVADRKVNEFSLDEVFDSEPKG
ncbi:hypothetical protein J7E95_17810 [Streptomyces sp. ISL-14]|nr:hypothetical protein [Bacillus sp. ISL-4]MBT2672678.1 hypothetical protein [Streptomyces sp. ISL-14]